MSAARIPQNDRQWESPVRGLEDNRMKTLLLLFLFSCIMILNGLEIQPENLFQHFVAPEENVQLTFAVNEENIPGVLDYHLYDSFGNQYASGRLKREGRSNRFSGNFHFPQGFYEIALPDRRFGIVALPDFFGNRDLFWGMNLNQFSSGSEHFQLLHRFGIQSFRKWHPYWAEEKTPGRWLPNPKQECGYVYAKKHGMAPLFYFNSVPRFMWKDRNRKGSVLNVFPWTYLPLEKSLNQMLDARLNGFGSYQVWNEPDLASRWRPGDSYLSFLAANSYFVRRSHPEVLLVSCGFSAMNVTEKAYRSYLSNGLLDLIDVLAFHNYTSPEEFLRRLTAFRRILAPWKRGNLPIWITESGKSWDRGIVNLNGWKKNSIGKLRAEKKDDLLSANWIVRKACLAKGGGVFRYFPFILTFHPEGRRNFGLLDFHQTPHLALGAYFFCARILAGKEYIGDYPKLPSGCSELRVFSDGKQTLGVLVANNIDKTSVDLSKIPHIRCYSIDGRELLPGKNGSYPFSGGVVYLLFPEAPLPLKTETSLMKLLNTSRNYRQSSRTPLPVVFTFDSSSISQYHLTAYITLPREFIFRISNLGENSVIVHPELELPPGARIRGKAPDAMTLSPKSERDLRLSLDFSACRQSNFEILLRDRNNHARPLILPFLNVDAMRKEVFRFSSSNSWKPNCAGGKMTVKEDPDEQAVHFHVDFRGVTKESHWVNPEYTLKLPEESLKDSTAISFEIRTRQQNGSFRFQYTSLQVVYGSDRDYKTYSYPVPTGPEWEKRIFLWPEDARLEDIRKIRIGLGPTSEILDYWIRNIKIHYSK